MFYQNLLNLILVYPLHMIISNIILIIPYSSFALILHHITPTNVLIVVAIICRSNNCCRIGTSILTSIRNNINRELTVETKIFTTKKSTHFICCHIGRQITTLLFHRLCRQFFHCFQTCRSCCPAQA